MGRRQTIAIPTTYKWWRVLMIRVCTFLVDFKTMYEYTDFSRSAWLFSFYYRSVRQPCDNVMLQKENNDDDEKTFQMIYNFIATMWVSMHKSLHKVNSLFAWKWYTTWNEYMYVVYIKDCWFSFLRWKPTVHKMSFVRMKI